MPHAVAFINDSYLSCMHLSDKHVPAEESNQAAEATQDRAGEARNQGTNTGYNVGDDGEWCESELQADESSYKR